MLPQKYVEMGFELTKFGEKSLFLKYRSKVIFLFDSYLDIRDNVIPKLCDYYLSAMKLGLKQV